MIGDVTHDDTTYTGDTGDGPTSIQFYRNKASEFQAVMEGVDTTYQSLQAAYMNCDDPGTLIAIESAMADISSHLGQIQTAAQAINLASEGVNYLGVRFPVVSVPSGLGALPLAYMVAIAGAIAGAAAIIVWGKTAIDTGLSIVSQAYAISNVSDPAKRDALWSEMAKIQAAKDKANSPLTDVANLVKWVAIAALGYMAFTAYQKSRG